MMEGTALIIIFDQARSDTSLEKSMVEELGKLEKAIEGRQFVAHANSILETEMATDKVNLPVTCISS